MFSQNGVCLLFLPSSFSNGILFLQAQKAAQNTDQAPAAAAAPVASKDGAVVSGADPEKAKQLTQAVAEQVSPVLIGLQLGLGHFFFSF